MKQPIKSKRDRMIAIILLFVGLYYSTMYYENYIDDFMIRFSPDKLNMMNYPGGWGNFLVVGVCMTIIIIVFMLITKIKAKWILVTGVIGILFTLAMLLGFVLHTNLIVGTSKTMKATSIWITSAEGGVNRDVTQQDKLTEKFIQAAVDLNAKSRAIQKELKAIEDTSGNEVYHVWISFPKKYGQSYDLILYVDGDRIYSYHGYGTPDNRVYYEDNGFCELLQKLLAAEVY